MTEREMRILLSTQYKGEGAKKMVSDLDKISASGEKASNVISKMNKTMGGDFMGGASESFRRKNPHLFPPTTGSPQGGAFMWSESELRRRTNQLLSSMRKEGNIETFGPQPPKISQFMAAMQKDRASFVKNAMFAATPIAAPTSLLGNFFATRQIFSALSGTKTGQGILGAVGLAGTGGAALATGGIMAILLAVGASLKLLEKTVRGVIAAFESARNLYSKSLTSGAGLGATSRREALASIIGVSSKDVYQFGQAILYLNPKIEWATNLMAKVTPNLTATAYQFSILKLNTEALFMSLADDAAPALRAFAEGLSMLVKVLEKSKGVLEFLFKSALMAAAGPSGGEVITLAFNALSASGGGAVPQPLAFMKQMRASAAEHMGFVVGFSGGNNPAQQTANHTRKMVQQLGIIIRHVGASNTLYNPFTTAQSSP